MGEIIGAAVICLDSIWRPEWTTADLPRFRAVVASAHTGSAWISDGNFAVASFDLRLPRADLVIWLERPKCLCLRRALTRVFRRGEPHRPWRLVKVICFIWNFDRVNRPRIERLLAEHGPEVPLLRLWSSAQTDAFLESLTAAAV
jgi:adenylate kinase family enzyme